jgi:hypothetical protein
VSSYFAGCEKPLFILEPLGVEFGASPVFLLVSVALAISMRLFLMKDAQLGSVQRSQAGKSGHRDDRFPKALLVHRDRRPDRSPWKAEL